MNVLALDRALIERWPVVKFMHGYLEPASAVKNAMGFRSPAVRPPVRRRMSRALRPAPLWRAEARPVRSALLLGTRTARSATGYLTIVVASEHMKREFVRNGVDSSRIPGEPAVSDAQRTAQRNAARGIWLSWPARTRRQPDEIRLNANPTHDRGADPTNAGVADTTTEADWTVAFVGRMTVLKGGDLLVDAIAQASARLGRAIRLLLIGDGPHVPRGNGVRRNAACRAPLWAG